MKTTLKLLTATVLATGAIASQAYASDPVARQRLADENAAYFQQWDNQGSVAGMPDKAKHSKTESISDNRMASVSQYPFPGSVPSDGGYVLPLVRHCHL